MYHILVKQERIKNQEENNRNSILIFVATPHVHITAQQRKDTATY